MNSKKLFILSPYPHGKAPSQRFRYEQYVDKLKADGFDIEFYPFINENGWDILYQKGKLVQKALIMFGGCWKRFKLLFKLKKADQIFVHREMAQFGPPIFEWITTKILRKKYIYDFDDAIWLPNFSASNAKVHWIKCYWKVPYCIRWAETVTVGNEYLAEYARKHAKNVVVIPTTIDMENHHNQTINYNQTKITIGWTGTHSTMHYLNEIVPALKKLEQEFTFDFIVISNKKPDFELKSLIYKEWQKSTEIEDLIQLSIGVMPLQEDQWSNGKCGFKALQYMSLGIPSVISPVGVNPEIIRHGENGFLASNEGEFYNILKELLTNAEMRQLIGLEGQKTIRERYSTTANLEKYRQVLGTAPLVNTTE